MNISARQRLMPRKDRVLQKAQSCQRALGSPHRGVLGVSLSCPIPPGSPVVVAEAGPPVGRPQQGLHRTCQVDKHVAHEEEPAGESRGLSGCTVRD